MLYTTLQEIVQPEKLIEDEHWVLIREKETVRHSMVSQDLSGNI
jgi:hypothetical protein